MKMNKKISTTSIILSAIALLADTIALAKLAYEIVATNQTNDIAVRFVIVILVFFLGMGLGSIGLRGDERERIEKILSVYIWAYLIMACLTYLGIISQFRAPYTFLAYISYVIIVAIEIAAFLILRKASNVGVTASFPLVLMTTSLIHALVLLYQFIYRRSIPDIQYVVGEMAFWLAWTLFAVPLLLQAYRGGRFRPRLR
jgi:hypothetical protein